MLLSHSFVERQLVFYHLQNHLHFRHIHEYCPYRHAHQQVVAFFSLPVCLRRSSRECYLPNYASVLPSLYPRLYHRYHLPPRQNRRNWICQSVPLTVVYCTLRPYAPRLPRFPLLFDWKTLPTSLPHLFAFVPLQLQGARLLRPPTSTSTPSQRAWEMESRSWQKTGQVPPPCLLVSSVGRRDV